MTPPLERRSGRDRRANNRGTSDRRKPGRPPNATPTDPGVPRRVKLPTAVYDALCRLSVRERVSVHALIIRGARALISGSPKNTDSPPSP